MGDIKMRLQETTSACLDAYNAWDADKKKSELRENLQEAIHELRKVGSRLEIEIAISEREQVTSKPLPVPPHRSSSKTKGAVESILPDSGSTVEKKESGSRRPRTRRPAPKKS